MDSRFSLQSQMKGFSVAIVGIFLLRLPDMLQCDKPLFAEKRRETNSEKDTN